MISDDQHAHQSFVEGCYVCDLIQRLTDLRVENERLMLDNQRLTEMWDTDRESLTAENERLRAENERLHAAVEYQKLSIEANVAESERGAPPD